MGSSMWGQRAERAERAVAGVTCIQCVQRSSCVTNCWHPLISQFFLSLQIKTSPVLVLVNENDWMDVTGCYCFRHMLNPLPLLPQPPNPPQKAPAAWARRNVFLFLKITFNFRAFYCFTFMNKFYNRFRSILWQDRIPANPDGLAFRLFISFREKRIDRDIYEDMTVRWMATYKSSIPTWPILSSIIFVLG